MDRKCEQANGTLCDAVHKIIFTCLPLCLHILLKDSIQQTPHRPYLLTPRCRVLLEQLTGLQLVKKFPAFHGTRRFITALTSIRHLSLSWASPIQSIYPHPTSCRYVLILSTHLRLRPQWSPSLRSPHQDPIRHLPPTHTGHMPRKKETDPLGDEFVNCGIILKCMLKYRV